MVSSVWCVIICLVDTKRMFHLVVMELVVFLYVNVCVRRRMTTSVHTPKETSRFATLVLRYFLFLSDLLIYLFVFTDVFVGPAIVVCNDAWHCVCTVHEVCPRC